MTKFERIEAMKRAGYRERYAMENGTETRRTINGHTLYIFKYTADHDYQDGNGATYDATRKAWIN